MVKSKDVVLAECGELTQPGMKIFSSTHNNSCILVLSAVRMIIRVNGRLYYMQPFTFLLHPVSEGRIQVETEGNTALRYMILHVSDECTDYFQEKGLGIRELHTLANPLAVEEIWKLLLHAQTVDTELAQEAGVCAFELLLCLLRQSSDGSVTKAAEVPHYDKLSMLRHDIYRHPEESWYIQDICNSIGISRPYFHKLYLAAFGTTCTQDVIASRITCAKRLLETTDKAISAISQQSGFETDVYFMRQFKRHVGMTPTAYRRIFRQSVPKKNK